VASENKRGPGRAVASVLAIIGLASLGYAGYTYWADGEVTLPLLTTGTLCLGLGVMFLMRG